MATVNLTRLKKRTEKKTKSISAANVTAADLVDTLALDILQLVEAPADAVLVDAYLIVKTAFDAGITAKVGFDGGAELVAALTAVDTVGFKAGALVDNTDHLLTGTGKHITLVLSALPTVGELEVVAVYDEPTLGCGNLTNYI